MLHQAEISRLISPDAEGRHGPKVPEIEAFLAKPDNRKFLAVNPEALSQLKGAYQKGVSELAADYASISRSCFVPAALAITTLGLKVTSDIQKLGELEKDFAKKEKKFGADSTEAEHARKVLNAFKSAHPDIRFRLNELPDIKKATVFYNNLSSAVARDIIECGDQAQRTLIMERWIRIAHECFEKGDFNAVNAIQAGLNNSVIQRLEGTRRGLSPEAQHMLAQFTHLIPDKPDQAMRAMEKAAKKSKTLIPYLGSYQTAAEFRVDNTLKSTPIADLTKSNLEPAIESVTKPLQERVDALAKAPQNPHTKTVSKDSFLKADHFAEKTGREDWFAASRKHEPKDRIPPAVDFLQPGGELGGLHEASKKTVSSTATLFANPAAPLLPPLPSAKPAAQEKTAQALKSMAPPPSRSAAPKPADWKAQETAVKKPIQQPAPPEQAESPVPSKPSIKIGTRGGN
jgi:hypothetical protein